jgi:hypothetical protein
MTQKELVLSTLTEASSPLTHEQLRAVTGIRAHSLRTVLYELRRDDLVERLVEGGRRAKYAVTRGGREQAPAAAPDAIRSRVAAATGSVLNAPFGPLATRAFGLDEQLTSFVRWLLIEHPELFEDDPKVARGKLEAAVAAYASETPDPLSTFTIPLNRTRG